MSFPSEASPLRETEKERQFLPQCANHDLTRKFCRVGLLAQVDVGLRMAFGIIRVVARVEADDRPNEPRRCYG